MNQIKYKTESDQSTIDVDENVTAIYHDGVELLARIAKLESHSSQTDELLGEVRAIQKTNKISNNNRRLVERGFSIFAVVVLLTITALGSFGIDMAREQEASLDRTEEKIDSLLAMGSSFEKTMGIKVGDTVTVSVALDSKLLKRLENVGSDSAPRLRGRVLARNGNKYIISHTLDDGSKILKERTTTSYRQVLPDYTNGVYGSGH
jgi:hypothetical protein